MNDNFYAVIMAGGGGTRLWPLSRKNSPKQLLKLFEGKSLFRIAMDRLEGLFPPERIYIVTVEEQIEKLAQQAPELPMRNYLIESMPRGTASVVGLAAIYLKKKDPDSVMAVLTADHVMENVPQFQNLITKAKDIAETGGLATIGIDPTYPSTGYGYIQTEGDANKLGAYKVKRFTEKPDRATAKKYLASGSCYWNSGMFIFSTHRILDEIKRQMPELMKILNVIKEKIADDGSIQPFDHLWASIKPETIDYGIMEGAAGVSVLPAKDLGWIDVGSWDSLASLMDTDEDGNTMLSKKIFELDTKNSFIQSTDGGRLIAVIGLEDIFIIEHNNALLVCKKGESQKVKEIIKLIRSNDLERFL